ncbi:MAG: hypothetical protein U0103_12940 [Candidatus Obscuribacterales bacterium]
MAKFRWTTQGSKPTMTVIEPPPSVLLLIIVLIAVGITMLVTGKVSEQKKNYNTTLLEHQKTKDTTKRIDRTN